MNKFQIGDRVICTKDDGGEPGCEFPRYGQLGTIWLEHVAELDDQYHEIDLGDIL